MASIVFDKFRDSWVLTSLGRTPSGIRMAIEPVRIIPSGDSEGLGDVIRQLLEEEEAQIPEPNYDDPDFKRTIFAKALGLKGYQQYLKAARCFYFRAEPSEISLEEWPRGRGGFLADNPVWKKVLPAGDFEGAVRFLINKTCEAGSTSGNSGTGGTRGRELGDGELGDGRDVNRSAHQDGQIGVEDRSSDIEKRVRKAHRTKRASKSAPA